MTRGLMMAVLAFGILALGLTHAGEKGIELQVKGVFTKDDAKDQQRGGPAQVHTVKLKAGKSYTIDMVSSQFDSYLRLLDPKGNQLAEDDDGGDGLNARIEFSCTMDGEYRVVATTFGAGALGNYMLTVKQTGVAALPSTAHSAMVGKPAPKFEADFGINGKVRKLADLNNKLVILHFCDIRSSSSVAVLPKLNELSKTHKDKGLTVVSLTFYPSDISQALEFDKETGKIRTIKKSDRQSDQALLTSFAEYHKVNHTLLALPKQNALDAFNAYVVNGMPQVVLIDRKGMVRLIDIAGEKGIATVEAELKKLLTEK